MVYVGVVVWFVKTYEFICALFCRGGVLYIHACNQTHSKALKKKKRHIYIYINIYIFPPSSESGSIWGCVF